MSVEGRLVRGKANYEAKKFLENSETLEYIATLEVEKPKAKKVKEPKEEKMEDTEEESKEEEDDKSDE